MDFKALKHELHQLNTSVSHPPLDLLLQIEQTMAGTENHDYIKSGRVGESQ